MATSKSIIPIYTTKGDAEAFLVYPYIYNRLGEWIGWVTPQKEIYSVLGHYVGFLGTGPRILRKRAIEIATANKRPPARPAKVYTPATIPHAPLIPEINNSGIYLV